VRPRIAAIVLAAGASKRMVATGAGEHGKLLEELDGQPLIAHAVAAPLGAGLETLVVVAGEGSAGLRQALGTRELQWVQCADAASGMGASLACGAAALDETEFDGVLVCLGDMPRVQPQHIRSLIDAFADAKAGRAAICVPVRAGRRGHPVLFGVAHIPALRELAGDHGARSILGANRGRIREVEIDDSAIHFDVDTRDELEAARSQSGGGE
jgi:molybdenum cofactor cytidylyltransferase